MSSRAWRRLSRRPLVTSRRTTTNNVAVVRRHVASVAQVTSLAACQAESSSHPNNDYNKSLAALALLTAGTLVFSNKHTHKTDCCGIAGVVGAPSHDARYVSNKQTIILYYYTNSLT